VSKSQSCHILKLERRYKTSKSLLYLAKNSIGFITFQRDLDIFCQSMVKNPVASICFGKSYPALLSIIGQ
jgi:hypothetical protein